MYDVIIAGAGAAGASAAYYLNESGLKVLVIEKMSLPRYKACGGGLSLVYLKQQFPFSFESIIEKHIKSITYTYMKKQTQIPVQDGIMGMVMRERFDEFILSHARCDICEKTCITGVQELNDSVLIKTSDGKTLKARYLIGADGANSVVRRSMHLPFHSKFLPAIETEIPITSQNRHLSESPSFIFEGPQYGYLWIFPKREFLSVGIVNMKAQKINMSAVLKEMMAARGLSIEKARIRGHIIPTYRPGNQIASSRVFLAGDAAGLADPISGEGIRPAIFSGQLAAEAIIKEQPQMYTKRLQRSLGTQLYKSLLVSKMFYPLREICLFLGAPNPISTHTVLKALSGQCSYLRVLAFSVTSLPYFIPFELAAKSVNLLAGDEPANALRDRIFPGNYQRKS